MMQISFKKFAIIGFNPWLQSVICKYLSTSNVCRLIECLLPVTGTHPSQDMLVNSQNLLQNLSSVPVPGHLSSQPCLIYLYLYFLIKLFISCQYHGNVNIEYDLLKLKLKWKWAFLRIVFMSNWRLKAIFSCHVMSCMETTRGTIYKSISITMKQMTRDKNSWMEDELQ